MDDNELKMNIWVSNVASGLLQQVADEVEANSELLVGYSLQSVMANVAAAFAGMLLGRVAKVEQTDTVIKDTMPDLVRAIKSIARQVYEDPSTSLH